MLVSSPMEMTSKATQCGVHSVTLRPILAPIARQ
jgi:hypothetical protein